MAAVAVVEVAAVALVVDEVDTEVATVDTTRAHPNTSSKWESFFTQQRTMR